MGGGERKGGIERRKRKMEEGEGMEGEKEGIERREEEKMEGGKEGNGFRREGRHIILLKNFSGMFN